MTTKNLLEKNFYVGERGPLVPMTFGYDISAATAGELTVSIVRPNGGVRVRTIPLTDITSASTGDIALTLADEDLNVEGTFGFRMTFADADAATVDHAEIYQIIVLPLASG
tara:strand:- start:1747 stop:2079 length:333 start_codon:yes stop_codon:yes gene_type:complete